MRSPALPLVPSAAVVVAAVAVSTCMLCRRPHHSHSPVNIGSLISGANQQHGNGDALSGMIGTALGHAQNVGPDAQINEQAVQKDHDQAYNQGNAGNLSASAMGSAAAIQAFKSFASGGQQQQSGGGSMIEKLLGMAMSEAAKVSSDGALHEHATITLTTPAALRQVWRRRQRQQAGRHELGRRDCHEAPRSEPDPGCECSSTGWVPRH